MSESYKSTQKIVTFTKQHFSFMNRRLFSLVLILASVPSLSAQKLFPKDHAWKDLPATADKW